MASQSEGTEKQRQTRMLRTLRAGDRVRATIRSTTPVRLGTVVDPSPFEADGVRRVKVSWDDGLVPHRVLPASIEVAEVDSTDTTHVCVDGRTVDDSTVPTETNEHGDRWCSFCGERILVDPKETES